MFALACAQRIGYSQPMNIVLMAGGGGTRLWPVSRTDNPKQFIDLGSGKTLLEHSFARARELTEPDNIFVATVATYEERIKKLLPEIPAENIFLETEKRDTAPAFAAVAVQLAALGRGEEPTIFMWSDHVFTDEAEFIGDLKRIPDLVNQNPDSIIIMGHTPTSPETGFGYIEIDAALPGERDVFKVKAFKEKPDLETAKKYVASGQYFWNMGYISLKPSYLLAQLKEHEPELAAMVEEFAQALANKDRAAAAAAYARAKKISIDFALLERTPRILVITGDYGWSDVGNWAAVQEIFGTKGDHAPRGHNIHVDSQNNYVYNATEKVVSLIGVKDTIVVVTDDAILVTHKNDAHKVKEVVAKLEQAGKKDVL